MQVIHCLFSNFNYCVQYVACIYTPQFGHAKYVHVIMIFFVAIPCPPLCSCCSGAAQCEAHTGSTWDELHNSLSSGWRALS